jgi:putative phosphoserine phosphatase / 1-acylglycerol-3-phosphate O-acyltransferase
MADNTETPTEEAGETTQQRPAPAKSSRRDSLLARVERIDAGGATSSTIIDVADAKADAQKSKRKGLPATAVRLLNPMTTIKAYGNFAGKMITRAKSEEKATVEDLVAEIERGPQGPQVVAAFDFDGTLIGGYSGNMLFQERRKRKEVTRDEMTGSITTVFKTMAKLVEANEIVAQSFARWEGKTHDEMQELSSHIYENAIQDAVFPEMREVLAAHHRAGHTIVCATSASRYQAEPAITALGIDTLLCTELEVKDGKLTGKLAGENLFGAGKAAAIKAFVEERGASLKDTHFYADGSEEVGLMESVGHPHPVNPGSKLLEAAKNNKWPVLRLTSRGGSKAGHMLRNIAGMATIGPVLQTGLAVGAVTRDKRAFANVVMPAWISNQMKLAGVKLRVSGRANLWARRPAVFIFNHRNFYDGMIAAALVKTDYAAIARKEMGENAVGKLVQKIMPTILIERGSGSKESAQAALQPVVDAMQKDGYSVMLSPEGTRTIGHLNSVGPFKKGAFHMAMAAKAPVVPIVIRNALDLAARSGGAMRPSTIDVAVLPPVSMDDWTPENMAAKIEEVRQSFIATLNDWPQPDEDE